MKLEAKDLTRDFPRCPRDTLAGNVIAARVLDKCRAAVAGTPGEYHFNCPLDRRFFDFIGIDAERTPNMTANTANSIPRLILPLWAAALLLCASAPVLNAAEIPKVGDKAPDFSLKSLDDQTVRLSELTAKGSVVLVVLRGWPGYQCPICDRQVQDFIKIKADFAEAKAKIVFVYPGPADGLTAHAKEFKDWKNKQWPAEFLYVLDPDYTMINAYGLRWDAPRETAYASTFLLDGKGTVNFVKTSRTHGGRTKAVDMLAEVKKLSEIK